MVFYKNVQRNTYRETPEDWDSSPFSQHFILKMNKTLQCFFFNMVLILWNQGKKGKKKTPINDQVKIVQLIIKVIWGHVAQLYQMHRFTHFMTKHWYNLCNF